MRNWTLGLGIGIVFLFFWVSCKDSDNVSNNQYELVVPDHFPTPEIPDDNPLTAEKIALGKRLFFDPILSTDSTVSCGSCHLQGNSFSDPKRFSFGVGNVQGKRQAPALINMVYGRSFFWHGGVPSLEQQVLFPIEDPTEMASSAREVMDKLMRHPEYPTLFEEAFGEVPTMKGLTDAIASFERTLITANSPYDRYLAGESDALSESQLRGMELFFGEKAECFHCHTGFNFTDESFQNNGLSEVYEDPGRWEITGFESDKGKFKVPTLRNIAYTSPYMHDGRFISLEQVVDHYISGGANHPNKSVLIRRFIFSDQERTDLLNFLHALSDEEFITNPAFQE